MACGKKNCTPKGGAKKSGGKKTQKKTRKCGK